MRIFREDLNPIEEAEAYQRLISEYKLKQDEVADKVSKSRVAITNALRLLKLDERVRRMVVEDKIKADMPEHCYLLKTENCNMKQLCKFLMEI